MFIARPFPGISAPSERNVSRLRSTERRKQINPAGAIDIWLLRSLVCYGFSRSYLHCEQVSERDGSRDFCGRGQETISGS